MHKLCQKDMKFSHLCPIFCLIQTLEQICKAEGVAPVSRQFRSLEEFLFICRRANTEHGQCPFRLFVRHSENITAKKRSGTTFMLKDRLVQISQLRCYIAGQHNHEMDQTSSNFLTYFTTIILFSIWKITLIHLILFFLIFLWKHFHPIF